MRKITIGASLGVVLLLAACGQQQSAADPAAEAAVKKESQEEANKKIAAAFFKEGIKPDEMAALMHDDYTQHNPVFKRFGQINNVKGKSEFEAVMSLFRTMPRPTLPADQPKGNPLYQVMADGDLVTVLQQRYLPDPQNPGKYYEAFWFDTWRIKDGKLFEHWDAQVIPTGRAEQIPPFLKGPMKLDTAAPVGASGDAEAKSADQQ